MTDRKVEEKHAENVWKRAEKGAILSRYLETWKVENRFLKNLEVKKIRLDVGEAGQTCLSINNRNAPH